MAAVSNAAVAGSTSAAPFVKVDIEEEVKKLIDVANKEFKLTHADIDKTHADKEYSTLSGRAKIYICKFKKDPAALIPVVYNNHMAYLVMYFVKSIRGLPSNCISYGNALFPVMGKEAAARIWDGTSTTVQIQLKEKS